MACPRHLRGHKGSQAELDASIRRQYGCTYAEAIALNGAVISDKGAPAYMYLKQRQRAGQRGVGWCITFPEWMACWGEKLAFRGRLPHQLCMARHGDVGPYAPGNVYITTNAQNGADRPMEVRLYSARTSRLRQTGRGRGWRFRPEQYPGRPYRVYCCQKFIGGFATQAEAEAAYRAAAAVAISDLTEAHPKN